MLFLHALIFFVLGTSVVAMPVPGNQQYQPDREYGRLDGWWKEHPREDKKPEHLMLIKDKKIVTFHPNDVEESQLNSESWYYDTIWGRCEGPVSVYPRFDSKT
ncbi:hypothetical protein F5887DRAFT_988788 [Amanita rubescens]|nr:hypothetical protein F5887DRAFT_988788 [Amanita rubescens]